MTRSWPEGTCEHLGHQLGGEEDEERYVQSEETLASRELHSVCLHGKEPVKKGTALQHRQYRLRELRGIFWRTELLLFEPLYGEIYGLWRKP